MQLPKCEPAPVDPDELSCADQLRALLLSILVLNIFVGQLVEVGSLVFGGVAKRVVQCRRNHRHSHAPPRPPPTMVGHEAAWPRYTPAQRSTAFPSTTTKRNTQHGTCTN